MDYFFCIVKTVKNTTMFYKGYFQGLQGNISYPAHSVNLSEAVKLTFKEEAEPIANALGSPWEIREFKIEG